jgi:hypothetical protein
MECLQLYNVHHNVEIAYNISTIFVFCAQYPQEQKFLSIASSSSLFVDSSLVAAAAANSSSVYFSSQNRNFLQLQNQYPMMTNKFLIISMQLYSEIATATSQTAGSLGNC